MKANFEHSHPDRKKLSFVVLQISKISTNVFYLYEIITLFDTEPLFKCLLVLLTFFSKFHCT